LSFNDFYNSISQDEEFEKLEQIISANLDGFSAGYFWKLLKNVLHRAYDKNMNFAQNMQKNA